MLTDVFVQIVFGWPFIILSLLVSLAGLFTKRSGWLWLGAVLLLPFSYYLSGAPGIGSVVLALPLFQLAAAIVIRRDKTVLACLLVLPAFLVSGWMAVLVLSQ